MNNQKISSFILQLRKEKKMTQQALADLLYVSDKAVSKWERGICLPDITQFSRIAEIFGVSVADLVNGERIASENKERKLDEILVDNIKQGNVKLRRKSRIIVLLVLIIFIILFSIFATFFFKNYKNIVTYSFQGESKNFEFKNGTAIFSKKNNMLGISDFNFSEDSKLNKDKIDTIKISVYLNGSFWSSVDYNKSEKNMSIMEWLQSDVMFYEAPSYECLHGRNNCGGTLISKINKNDFPNNMEIKLSYCIEKDCKDEVFEIYSKKVATNKFTNGEEGI